VEGLTAENDFFELRKVQWLRFTSEVEIFVTSAVKFSYHSVHERIIKIDLFFE